MTSVYFFVSLVYSIQLAVYIVATRNVRAYFLNKLNYLDFLVIILSLLCSAFGWSGYIFSEVSGLLTCLAICLWFKLLAFFRVNSAICTALIVIKRVIPEVFAYVVLLFLAVGALAHCLVLQTDEIGWSTVLDNLTLILEIIIGNLEGQQRQIGMAWLFSFIFSFFVVVIALNLIVAVVVNRFSEIEAKSKEMAYRQWAKCIVEIDYTLSSKFFARIPEYLILITPRKSRSEIESHPEFRALNAKLDKLIAKMESTEES